MKASQYGRLSTIILVTIKIVWDFTGDVVYGNNIAIVADAFLVLCCISVAILLWSDAATIDSILKERTAWRTRAVQAETNLLNLGRAVTDRLNARAMRPNDRFE